MKQRDNEQGMNYWKKEIMKKEGMIERKGWWMDEDREREERSIQWPADDSVALRTILNKKSLSWAK